MNDVFKEQLVARKNDYKVTVKKVAIVIIAIVILLAAFLLRYTTPFVPVIALILAFVVYKLFSRENIEYEYIFTNGDLDIDVIINKSSRKHLLTVDVKSIKEFYKKSHQKNGEKLNKYSKVFDYSSREENQNKYCVVFEHNKEMIMMIIEPNEKMLEAIRVYIPKIIKK